MIQLAIIFFMKLMTRSIDFDKFQTDDWLGHGPSDPLWTGVDWLRTFAPVLRMRRSAAPSQLGSTAKRPRFTPPTLGNRPTTLKDTPPPTLNHQSPTLNHQPPTPRNHTATVSRTPVLHDFTRDSDRQSAATIPSSQIREKTDREVGNTKHKNTKDILKLIMQCKSVMWVHLFILLQYVWSQWC